LDDYKDLEDNVAWLTTKLELSQSALAIERSRVERRNEMIHNLKDEIEALKRPQSTMFVDTTRSTSIVLCCAVITPEGPAPVAGPTQGSQPGYRSRG
jgi:hypothetical protein